MDAAPIITPIIHHNGDTRETLLTQLEQAYRAVRIAMETLQKAAPNSRNYDLEPTRFEQVQKQHAGRMAQLKAVKLSLEEESIQIQDQVE